MSLKHPNKLVRPSFYNNYNSSPPSSLLMGSKFSQNKEKNYSSDSDHGRSLETGPSMGSGASSRNTNMPVHYRSRGASLSEGSIGYEQRHTNLRYQNMNRSSPQLPRPLPHGPGPLLPSNALKVSKRRQTAESVALKVKGPLKASHDLSQKGISNPRSPKKSPEPLQTLSRKKSRSLNDVRGFENKQDQKASADKILTDADLKKARRTFKISRSPSCDNVSNPRQTPEHRALLDKMSKISTDETSDRKPYSQQRTKKSPGTYSPKAEALVDMSKSRSHVDSYQKSLFKKELQAGNPLNRISIARSNSLSNRDSVVQSTRKLSDSAYESNGTTSSGSNSSSPKMIRKMSSGIQSSELPSGSHGNGLVGLRNLGNTCFMNSIIQCLRNTKMLREIFCSNYFAENLNQTTAPTKGRLATAFSGVMKEMWTASRGTTVVSPSSLKSQVQRYAPRFTGYSQQDSQEFLRFLLEGLHDDLNIVREKVKIDYGCENKLSDSEQARRAWNWYAKREKSVISDLFVGQLKSTLTCTDCNHRSLTFDPFWDLSLPIPSRTRTSLIYGKVSLNDCFKKFTQEEVLDGDEKPTCEMCKKRQKCYKRFSIERFPHILVLHLKRFSGLRYRTKLDTMVDFPLELNLSSYAANSTIKKSEALYRLYGVSNHSGGTYSGHYTAYCRHPDTNDWYYYSDTSVMKLSSGRIVTEEAYVLFYEIANQMSYL